MPAQYFSVLLQRQECLKSISLFRYTGKSAGRVLLSFVTEARLSAQYFSVLLQRQECLHNTSQFCYRGKSAWTTFLNFATEARVSGAYFSVLLQRQECLESTFQFRHLHNTSLLRRSCGCFQLEVMKRNVIGGTSSIV